MSAQRHSVVGNGERDGSKKMCNRAISSQALRDTGRVQRPSRKGVGCKHTRSAQHECLTMTRGCGKVFSMTTSWSREYAACVVCGRSDRLHMARGRCRVCYLAEYRNVPKNARRIAESKARWYRQQSSSKFKAARERRHFSGQREAVLKRDGYRCVKCGARRQLTVHHRDGQGRGHASPNNLLNNLEAQCRACHAREHSALDRWARDYGLHCVSHHD